MNPRILIVDDHEIVREGIRNLLARSGKNCEVCGEPPMPETRLWPLSHCDLMRSFWKSPCRTLIFTLHESPRIAVEVRDAGGHGYVSKSRANRDLVLAFQTLLSAALFSAPRLTLHRASNENPDGGMSFRTTLPWSKRLCPRST